MGQAKRRGTFEERKAAAIAREEAKQKKLKIDENSIGVIGSGRAGKSMLLGMAAAMGGPMKRPLSGNRHHPPQVAIAPSED